MSAAEVIEMIKKLPPEEMAEVIAFARSGEGETAPADRKIRYIDHEKAKATAEKIFDRHSELFRRLAQ
jgi:hypothetical protein